MSDFQQQHELEMERFELTVEALKRCAAAGAKKEDIERLASECGVDIRYITIGGSNG